MREAVTRQIADERAAILAFLAGARDQDWDRPTICAGWSVKDVLSHMVEGELAAGRVYRGEIREQGFADPQQGVDTWRALPGAAVRAALWQHGTATQRVLNGMSEEVWRSPIRAFGCREIRQLVRLHLFELVLHGHDLTDALGADPVWGGRLAFVTEFVVRAAPDALRRSQGLPRESLAVRVHGRDEPWVVNGSDADTTIELDAEDLVLATTGRCAIEEVMSRARISGSAATAERILKAWQVLADPQ